jgi:tungstate transport system substrate-binding protein
MKTDSRWSSFAWTMEWIAVAVMVLVGVTQTHAQSLLAQPEMHDKTLVMASTTSTEQSGLFAHLLPAYTAATGVSVKVIAVGTGQALDLGRRGDADVLFVHDPQGEALFVAQGHGLKRWGVMYNDFVLVGDKQDVAKVRGLGIEQAFKAIAKVRAPLLIRGDKSGTDVAQERLMKGVGMGLDAQSVKSCGCGMGPALNMAASMGAYTLADRGTWLNFKNKQDLEILVQGDEKLFNPYGVIAVNPQMHPHVNLSAAQSFIDWVRSPRGQQTIADYKINGQQLFFPNAQSVP